MIKRVLLLSSTSLMMLLSGCALYDMLFTITPKDALSNKNFYWMADTSQHINYHYEDSSCAKDNIFSIKEVTEKSIKDILKLTGEAGYYQKIDYFLLSSKDRMFTLTKYRMNSSAYPRFNAVYAIYSKDLKAVGAHELNHIIVHNLWGSQGEKFLSEGFAVFSDSMWNGCDLHSISKYLLKKKKLLSIQELIGNFSKYSSMVTYPQSGSFIKFLYETYGREKMKLLWGKGSNDIKEIYKKDLPALENEWLSEVEKKGNENIDYEYQQEVNIRP